MNKAANNTGTTATATAKAPECTETKRDYPESPMQKLAREAADEEATRLSAHVDQVKNILKNDTSEIKKLADKLNIPEYEISAGLNKREVSIHTARSLSQELNIPLQLFNINEESIKKDHEEENKRYYTEKVYTEKEKGEIIAKALLACVRVILDNNAIESEDKIDLINCIAYLGESSID